ncbi:tyrosine-type recombinase/integrase [Streptococcus uberis]|uniref:tyrosine-type recombinase/integrase n=1 Tax=Streptococcus uberis TaxID=1349 RepID=UPI0012B5B4CB|nr:tyrosine-type recombinase/integrase [Streptococcus uberis]MTB56357.1 tyrosine-type recombinase/integrase [Streptococcus uberis]
MKIIEYKKKNGTIMYRSQVYLGVDRITGKKARTSVSGRTKKELKNNIKLAKFEFQANGETLSKKVEVKTYSELVDLWLESYKLTVKPQTFRVTSRYINCHLLPRFGKMKLDKIKNTDIQSFVNKLTTKLVNFREVNSLNTRILQYGVSLNLIPFNPARDVILPKSQKSGRESVKFIDTNDLKALLKFMENQSFKRYRYHVEFVLYKLLLATGLRIGEAVALEWSDIDLENATIDINKSFSQELRVISTTKTKAGTRLISIDKETVNLLKLYQVRQRQLFHEVGAGVPKITFSTPTRDYISRVTLQTNLDNRCKRLGIPRFTFHAFRHTHASLLLNAGISYKELQYRLGHSNIAMTLDVYSHLSKDKEKEAVSYYEKAINSI